MRDATDVMEESVLIDHGLGFVDYAPSSRSLHRVL